VLVEDQNQQRFVLRYLKRLGYKPKDIRFEPLTSGGSGEQWVRTRYALNVQAYRARSAKAESSLVVAIDADTDEVARRTRQLEETLAAEGLSPRTDREKIVHLIPRRNIETWILNLNGERVDEETDYRHRPGVEDQFAAAAATFFDWTRPNALVPPFGVASLRAAIPEIKRLEYER
jgi:hypothetical protein